MDSSFTVNVSFGFRANSSHQHETALQVLRWFLEWMNDSEQELGVCVGEGLVTWTHHLGEVAQGILLRNLGEVEG